MLSLIRLIHNLGALLKACWLPVEKVQQRVWISLKDPKGAAWSAHLLRLVSRKGIHPDRRDKTQQLHASGHAEQARRCTEPPEFPTTAPIC